MSSGLEMDYRVIVLEEKVNDTFTPDILYEHSQCSKSKQITWLDSEYVDHDNSTVVNIGESPDKEIKG